MQESNANTVKFRLGGKLPEGLEAVGSDERPIDYSDVPELSDAWFEHATRLGNAQQEAGQHPS
jgi:hypothetical protein